MLGVLQVFDDPVVRRAKQSVDKAGLFTSREKRFIQRKDVERILTLAGCTNDFWPFALLFLLAYAFLLRLPSEALPTVVGRNQGQSSLYRDGETLVLDLKRR